MLYRRKTDFRLSFTTMLAGEPGLFWLYPCLERADSALYQAKSEGRERVVAGDPITGKV